MERTIFDLINWKVKWTIYKWGKDPENRIATFLQNGGTIPDAMRIFGVEPIVEKIEGNIALNEGLQELIDLICGIGAPTEWDNANARIGVGDSNAAEQATHTGLQAAVNKTWKGMDATYPQKSGQTAEWRATFGSAEGNHGWQEFTVVNAANDAGKNLNRKIADKGTKSVGESWTAVLQITFS